MSISIPNFPEEQLNDIIALSSIQETLVTITQEKLDETYSKIKSLFFEVQKFNIKQFIQCFFYAAEYRFRLVPFYCYLIKKIIVNHPDTSENIKKAILHSFIQPASLHSPRCFFIRSCMNQGILTAKEIVEKCRSFYMMRPSNPERLITSFCWFCPEIEAHDIQLYQLVLSSLLHRQKLGMIIPLYDNFLKIVDPLRANNWQLYHSCIQCGFNPDRFAIIICRDEVDALKAEMEKNGFDANSYFLPHCILDGTHILSETSPSFLHLAAYFGAFKCLDYLVSIGADISSTSEQHKTLLMFAVAGGNIDMVKKVIEIEESTYKRKANLQGVFEIAARYHQNHIFEFLLEKISSCECAHDNIRYFELAINECVISNNISLILKCLEKGVDVNYEDYAYISNDLIFFIKLHF